MAIRFSSDSSILQEKSCHTVSISGAEFLKSLETPKYYVKVKNVLQEKWNGLSVKDAKIQQVDVVTGATYSSEAV